MNVLIRVITIISVMSFFSSTFGQEKQQEPNSNSFIEFGYRNIRLGMTFSEVKQNLTQDNLVQIEPIWEPDFFGPRPTKLLQARALPFILHIDYHFIPLSSINSSADKTANNKSKKPTWILYEIVIQWNPKYQSYLSLYTYLQNKYGTPKRTRARYSFWQAKLAKMSNASNVMEGRIVLNQATTVRIVNWSVLQSQKKNWIYQNKSDFKSHQLNIQQSLLNGL